MYQALSLVVESLARRDLQTNEFVPQLAESWVLADDRKSVTVKLRPAALWHDGAPVTADDVIFSWRALRDPVFKGLIWGAAYHDFLGAEKVDQHTVRFRWRQAHYDNLVQILLLRILPQHFFVRHQQDSAFLSRHLLGSGPYRLQQIQKGHALTLVQNPHWWGRAVPYFRDWYQFPIWNFIYVNGPQMAVSLMQRNQLHFFAMHETTPTTFAKQTKAKMPSNPVRQITYQNHVPDRVFNLACNLQDPILSPTQVRKALNHLIPREPINEKFFNRQRQLTSSPWGRQTAFLRLSEPLWPYSPVRARALLRSAKWEIPQGKSIWQRAQADRVQILQLTVTYYQTHLEKILTYLQEALRSQGIELRLQLIPPTSLVQQIQKRNFQLLAYDEMAYGEILPMAYHSQGKYNTTGLASAKVDQLIDRLQIAFEPDQRRAIEAQLAKEILAEVPEIFILSESLRQYLVHSDIVRPQDSWPYGIGLAKWSFKARAKD